MGMYKKFKEEKVGKLVSEEDSVYFDIVKIIKEEGCVGNDYIFSKLKPGYPKMRDAELKLRIMQVTSRINEEKAWNLQVIKDL